MKKNCYKCGETKATELFAKNKQSKGGRENQCQACRTKEISDKRRSNKIKSIEYLGGACRSCGGVYSPAVYDFHHTDPTTKDADPGTLMNCKWERIKEELDKCILLCANCHRMVHEED